MTFCADNCNVTCICSCGFVTSNPEGCPTGNIMAKTAAERRNDKVHGRTSFAAGARGALKWRTECCSNTECCANRKASDYFDNAGPPSPTCICQLHHLALRRVHAGIPRFDGSFFGWMHAPGTESPESWILLARLLTVGCLFCWF